MRRQEPLRAAAALSRTALSRAALAVAGAPAAGVVAGALDVAGAAGATSGGVAAVGAFAVLGRMKKNHAAANATTTTSSTTHSGVPRRWNSISAMRSSLARGRRARRRSFDVRKPAAWAGGRHAPPLRNPSGPPGRAQAARRRAGGT